MESFRECFDILRLEFFIQLHVSEKPVVRRLLTRLLGLIPSMVVAVALGRPGIDTLLVASQVVLAIVLPFITFPLIWLTSSKKVMSVRMLEVALEPGSKMEGGTTDPERVLPLVDFSSGKIVTGVGVLIWLIMVAANAYVIITLAMGQGDD
jgi:metal iron transporter